MARSSRAILAFRDRVSEAPRAHWRNRGSHPQQAGAHG